MYCYNCGKKISEKSVYCMYCGSQVNVLVNSENVSEEKPADDKAPESPEPEVFAPEVETLVPEPEVLASEPEAQPTVESNIEEQAVEEADSKSESEQSSSESQNVTAGSDKAEPEERVIAPHAIGSFIWAIVANECCVIPVLGLTFSIIALVKSIKGRNIVALNPEKYKLKGFLTAAFILSIIDLVGSIIGPIAFFSYFSFLKDLFKGSGFSDIFTGFVNILTGLI